MRYIARNIFSAIDNRNIKVVISFQEQILCSLNRDKEKYFGVVTEMFIYGITHKQKLSLQRA